MRIRGLPPLSVTASSLSYAVRRRVGRPKARQAQAQAPMVAVVSSLCGAVAGGSASSMDFSSSLFLLV